MDRINTGTLLTIVLCAVPVLLLAARVQELVHTHTAQWVKRASESRIFQANLPLCDMSEREKETSPTQQMCNWAPTMEKHSRRCLRKRSYSRLLRFGKMDLLRWI